MLFSTCFLKFYSNIHTQTYFRVRGNIFYADSRQNKKMHRKMVCVCVVVVIDINMKISFTTSFVSFIYYIICNQVVINFKKNKKNV